MTEPQNNMGHPEAHLRAAHLTDEQFTAYTLGEVPELQARLHLQSCVLCREEMARFGASIRLFNQTSLQWSEGRSAILPTPASTSRRRTGSPAWGRLTVLQPWTLGLATAVLALGVAIPAGLHWQQHHDSSSSTASVAVASADSVAPSAVEPDPGTATLTGDSQQNDQQIAADNELLASVSVELDRSAADLQAAANLAGRTGLHAGSQDGGQP